MKRHRSTKQRPSQPVTEPQEALRTFIAIELDEATLLALTGIQQQLKSRIPSHAVRWVNPNGIHLTLKFLGATPEDRLEEIREAMKTAIEGMAPFEFRVEGRGCFPNFRQPNVIWVAVRDVGGKLSRLQRAIEDHVAPLGWPTEKRPFRPHLTLGRVARDLRPDERRAVGEAVETFEVEEIATVQVSEVSLMRSDLLPTGARYTRLFAIPLAERAEP